MNTRESTYTEAAAAAVAALSPFFFLLWLILATAVTHIKSAADVLVVFSSSEVSSSENVSL